MGNEIDKSTKIIFIGGTGRSGTNITKKVLSRHSDVFTLPFEYRFIIDPEGIVDFYNCFSSSWSPFMADHKIKKLECFLKKLSQKNSLDFLIAKVIKKFDKSGKILSPKPYVEWELNQWLPKFNYYTDDLISKLNDFEYSGCWPGTKQYSINNKIYHSKYKNKSTLSKLFGDYINSVIYELLKNVSKEIFIEDNTWNILYAKELFELVPNGKLIHIYRDPRDVVASYIHQRWCPNKVKQATVWYRSIIEKWFSIKTHINPLRYIEIKLEDLVKNPKSIISKICEFIDLPFEEKLINIDLSKSNSGRWREEFSESEKTYINGELKDIINILGYKQ